MGRRTFADGEDGGPLQGLVGDGGDVEAFEVGVFEAGAVWGEAGGVSWVLLRCCVCWYAWAEGVARELWTGGRHFARWSDWEMGREARTSLDTASGARTRWTARAWCGHWCGMAVRQVTRRSSLAVRRRSRGRSSGVRHAKLGLEPACGRLYFKPQSMAGVVSTRASARQGRERSHLKYRHRKRSYSSMFLINLRASDPPGMQGRQPAAPRGKRQVT